MRIVLISSVFFPRNSPRALRTTELAKYFASEGHDVTVYSCTGKYDYSEFHDKFNVTVKNIPDRKFSKLESDGSGKITFVDKILTRMFSRAFEWPSIELMFRMKRILVSETEVDMLISVAIPYPIHWGIAMAKKSLGINFPRVWISDCGDPYMGNSVGKKHPFYFKYLEKFWCKNTNYITVPIEKAKSAYYSEFRNKIIVIPQGFNMLGVDLDVYKKNEVPTFAFAGATYPGYRDPSEFLEYLTTLNTDFRFIVFTPANSIFHKYESLLKGKLIIRSYIPRPELLKFLSKMDFLININNGGDIQSPSKLIDYAISQRPILSISSVFTQKEKFSNFLQENYTQQDIIDLAKYDIRTVGNQFLKLSNGRNDENSNL